MPKLNKIATLAAAVTLLNFTPTLAIAGLTDGFYVSAFAGASKPLDTSFDNFSVGTEYRLKSDWGFNVDAAVGYKFDCFRTELGVGYTKNNADRLELVLINVPQGAAPSDQGDQQIVTTMLNSYYDFKTHTPLVISIGAGIGAAYIDHSFKDTAAGYTMSGDETVFAYQFIVGLGYDFARNWRASVDYRFLGTTRANYTIKNGSSTDVGGNYTSHRVNAGITYFFCGV